MLNLNSDPFRYVGAVVKIDKNIGTGKFSRSPVLERRKTRTFLYLFIIRSFFNKNAFPLRIRFSSSRLGSFHAKLYPKNARFWREEIDI